VGRESPATLFELGTMPLYGAVSWQVWQAATAPLTVVCPETLSVGLATFALPRLKPPALTVVVVWQPEPLQSNAPMGKWSEGVLTIVIFAKEVATADAWQLRQPVTPWCVPVTE